VHDKKEGLAKIAYFTPINLSFQCFSILMYHVVDFHVKNTEKGGIVILIFFLIFAKGFLLVSGLVKIWYKRGVGVILQKGGVVKHQYYSALKSTNELCMHL